jgi:hypothetical protein
VQRGQDLVIPNECADTRNCGSKPRPEQLGRATALHPAHHYPLGNIWVRQVPRSSQSSGCREIPVIVWSIAGAATQSNGSERDLGRCHRTEAHMETSRAGLYTRSGHGIRTELDGAPEKAVPSPTTTRQSPSRRSQCLWGGRSCTPARITHETGKHLDRWLGRFL